MLHQEADPANDHQCDTGNEKEREKSRLPVLAWRSVRGEVGGCSIDQTRSHPIPV
jgi:hypothetical protein